MKWWILWVLLLSAQARADITDTPAGYAAWIDSVAKATRQMDYQGVFVYQHQNGIEISHISHRFDRQGEIARLDALSGAPRSYLRVDDAVYCYISSAHRVTVEHRPHHPFFPDILPYPAAQLGDFYEMRSLGHAEIAAHDSTGVSLIPRDGYRYGYALWADSTSHILLRLIKLDAHQQASAQFSFTQIDIGHAPSRSEFQNGFKDKKQINLPEHEIPTRSNWRVPSLPPGFHKLTETQMNIPGNQQHITHLVYSDGLATVSLFIEPHVPAGEPPQHGLAERGAMMLYTRPLDNHQVTALGEVPPATLMMMSDNLQSVEPGAAAPKSSGVEK